MAQSLFQHGAIRTTEPKAKELRKFVERLITIAKKGTLFARRRVIAEMQDRMMADDEGTLDDKTVVQKLFDEVAPRYANRAGGYTRIIHLADRRIGDAGSQVLLQLVEETPAEAAAGPATSSRRKLRGDKRRKMAAAGLRPAEAAVAEAEAPAAEAQEPKAEGEQAKE